MPFAQSLTGIRLPAVAESNFTAQSLWGIRRPKDAAGALWHHNRDIMRCAGEQALLINRVCLIGNSDACKWQ